MSKLGRVIATRDGKAVVSFEQSTACQECGKCKGIDFGFIERKDPELEIDNKLGLKVGDCVNVEIDEGAIILAAFLTYLFPLVAMIVGYFAAQPLSTVLLHRPATEGVEVIGSVTFLVLSILALRRLNPWFDRKNSMKMRITRA